MANRETGRAYKSGLGYEVHAKVASKRNPEQEEEVASWISTVSGQQKPDGESYENWLKNGVVLCNVANSIQPGCVKTVKTKGGAFAFMENITNFISCISKYGVAVEETFQTVDLWEKQNIPAVTNSLFAFSRALQKNPKFSSVPALGPVASAE